MATAEPPHFGMVTSTAMQAALHDAAVHASTDQAPAAVAGTKRKLEPDTASQQAMQAELEALQQQNQTLLKKLMRVLNDSRLMNEENLTIRRIIAAVSGSPAQERADAAFIRSPYTSDQQQLQRQLSRQQPSQVAIRPSSASMAAAAGTASPAGARAGSQPTEQPCRLGSSRLSIASPATWAAVLNIDNQQQQPQQQEQYRQQPDTTAALAGGQLLSPGQLLCPQELILPAEQQDNDHQQGCCHIKQQDQLHDSFKVAPPFSQGGVAAASVADIAVHTAGAAPGVIGYANSAAQPHQSAQPPACALPVLPVLEQAAAVLACSKEAGLLDGVEVNQITAAIATGVAVRCGSTDSSHPGATDGAVAPATRGALGSLSEQRVQQEEAATASAACISQRLVEKVAARALAKAKGEASSALLGLVAAGTGVPVKAITDPLKAGGAGAISGGVCASAVLLQDGLHL